MYKIKEAIVVEGTYDQIKLSGFLDATIIKTNGFTILKDKNKLEMLKLLAEKTGIVILTDSDSAGFKIRSFIKQYITKGTVKNAYIPDVFGKERRKTQASKEGLLGVEGLSQEIILTALENAGCEINGDIKPTPQQSVITKADLYTLGLSGKENSLDKRHSLCKRLNLPAKISSNMLVSVLNKLMTYEQLQEIIKNDEI